MDFITWSENDAVNVESIDAQHRKMINIVNHLHSLFTTKDRSDTTLLELDEYLKEHFHTEETFMIENKYPGYISHKLEHDRYYAKISNFVQSINKGNAQLNLEILNSLKKSKAWNFPRP